MAVLFVSHASKDDATAVALEAWLRDRGFTDLFIDHSSIDAGEKWREALRDAAGACRIVVCIVTENWLASDVCFGEFEAAWLMGKRIIPLFALGSGVTAQPKRLGNGRGGGSRPRPRALPGRPWAGLDLDARPGNRAPPRKRTSAPAARSPGSVSTPRPSRSIGLSTGQRPSPALPRLAMTTPMRRCSMAAARNRRGRWRNCGRCAPRVDLRPYVIVGASGSGKSSLLKAGIVPRLRREPPAWLPLRAFRPGGDPLLNFAEAIARTLLDLKQAEAHGVLRDRLFDAWAKVGRPSGKLTLEARASLQEALEEVGGRLRKAAGSPGATIFVGVDQAEELARADGESGDALRHICARRRR